MHAALTGGEFTPAIAQQIATDLPARSVAVGLSSGGYVARGMVVRYAERGVPFDR
ncbi:hypothetical protein [Leeia sp.]|uniref:hypothetical protein n=1 Tax=Leeia sp. TaxID=2884678 RepID=UPI0035B2E3DB